PGPDRLRDREQVRRADPRKLLWSSIRPGFPGRCGHRGTGAHSGIPRIAAPRPYPAGTHTQAAGGRMASWRRITGAAGLVAGATAAGAGAIMAAERIAVGRLRGRP